MLKSVLLMSVLAAGFNAQANNRFSDLPIDLASPTGIFGSQKGWRFVVGIGAELESEYHGSAETVTEADPYIELSYRSDNWEFQSNIFANRLVYHLNDQWFVTGWLNHEEGREQSEAGDGSLAGMGNIDDMLEWGGGVSWRATDKLTFSLAGQGYTNGEPDKGLVGFLFAHYRLIDSHQWKLDIKGDISFADGDHLTTEFGVTPAQAITSSYDAYSIGSGIKSYGFGIRSVYAINRHMLFLLTADYEILASDSADSPLIKAGSDTEVEAGVTFIYRF